MALTRLFVLLLTERYASYFENFLDVKKMPLGKLSKGQIAKGFEVGVNPKINCTYLISNLILQFCVNLLKVQDDFVMCNSHSS